MSWFALALSLLAVAVVVNDAGAGSVTREAPSTPGAALTLDGAKIGPIAQAEVTLSSRTVVVSDPKGRVGPQTIGAAGEIRFAVGPEAGPAVWKHIASTLAGKASPLGGVLATAAGVYTFVDAVISEVHFPALDAAADKTVRFGVVLTPTSTVRSGATPFKAPPVGKTQPLLASAFRLSLAGLDTKKVLAIDAFAAKTGTRVVSTRERVSKEVSGAAQVQTLTVHVLPSGADSFGTWYEQTLKGKEGAKTGTLEYLTPTGKTAMKVDLQGVRLLGMRDVVRDGVRDLEIDLSVDGVTLEVVGAAAAAP